MTAVRDYFAAEEVTGRDKVRGAMATQLARLVDSTGSPSAARELRALLLDLELETDASAAVMQLLRPPIPKASDVP